MALAFAELQMYRHPELLARLRAVRRRVHEPLAPLTVTLATSAEPVPFSGRLDLRYRPARVGTTWGRAFTCAWFHVTGQVPGSASGRHVALVLDTDGEQLVLDASGRVLAALSSRTTPVEQLGSPRGKTRLDLTEQIAPGGQIDLWLDAGFNGKLVPPLGRAHIKRLDLVSVRDDIEALYHDLLACSYAALATSGSTAGRYRAALSAAQRLWADFAPEHVAAARAKLAPLLHGTSDDSLAVTAIGHGHLDLAWLWPIRETRRKAQRTLTYQLDQLERFPEARYGVSQPQQLAWLAEQAPDLFGRVRQAVHTGRIEAQGGMWVEPDTNLPSGESLVRQVLIGQRYWSEQFGRRPDICWLPDVFGYSGNLPQILLKGGMARFMTIKLSWNEHNDFPHRSFRWQGIDGSEVLVHMPPEGSYNSSASPLALRMLIDSYPEKQAAPEALLVYGSGDGGGGPGPAHLEQLARAVSLDGLPRVQHGTATEFFDRLSGYADRLPVFRGELYLEKHQGTYTSQAANKRWNRRIEHRLHDVEYLAALAWTRGRDWPKSLLDETWREALLYQFHDILPGSSIARVHAESVARYLELDAALVAEQHAVLAELPPGPRSLVNTLPTRRRGYLRDQGVWRHYDAPPFATVPLVEANPDGLVAEADTLANDHLRVTFGADGLIASLIDRATGREHAGEGLNRLVIHKDRWSYFDAWDINMSYLRRAPEVLRPVQTETFIDGPRAVRRHVYRYRRSTIEQDLVLCAGLPYLLVETRLDWHETWRMLRAEFRPTTWSDEVTCHIQYGHLSRSTRDETPTQRAQFEICAHQWVDVSDAEGGLCLMNDGKYGHRAKEGLLSLNLVRGPVYPDKTADRGRQEFAYALYPHAGQVTDSDAIALAADLNAPHVIADTPACDPIFVVDGDGVLLDVVKVAEDGDALIVRLHEAHGRSTTATLLTALPIVVAHEVNLLEEGPQPVDLNALSFGPFEIKTLRLGVRGQ